MRPSDLRLAAAGVAARIEMIEELGDTVVLDLRVGDQAVKLKADLKGDAASRAREGELVHLAFDPASVHLFDRSSGERLN